MSTYDSEDHREYYRIDDQIALQISAPAARQPESRAQFDRLASLHGLNTSAGCTNHALHVTHTP